MIFQKVLKSVSLKNNHSYCLSASEILDILEIFKIKNLRSFFGLRANPRIKIPQKKFFYNSKNMVKINR